MARTRPKTKRGIVYANLPGHGQEGDLTVADLIKMLGTQPMDSRVAIEMADTTQFTGTAGFYIDRFNLVIRDAGPLQFSDSDLNHTTWEEWQEK
jgi:hypothetical protein